METFYSDVRYGIRMLLKRKGFSLVVVATLALAIGANATLFSMVSTVLFLPMPFDEPDRIAFLYSQNPSLNRMRAGVSVPDFADLREELESFEGLAAFAWASHTLTGVEEPVRVAGVEVSANFFPLMGIDIVEGRPFTGEDDQAESSPVAILSHGAWERRFGSDPQILRRTLFLDSKAHTVVGVLQPEMDFGVFQDIELWTPLVRDAERADREDRFLRVAGRLVAGRTVEEADVESRTIADRLARAHPASNRDWTVYAISFSQALFVMGRNVKSIFLLLAMTTGFVLLIACANVANMLLTRSAVRSREVAVRSALGASRSRIVRQLLTESSMLSILGASFGLVLVRWTIRALGYVAGDEIPLLSMITIDEKVLSFALLMALATPLVFGLVPALRASRSDLNEDLKDGMRTSSGRARNYRGLLVAGEVAMALVLLVISGLAVQSMQNIRHIELGFEPKDVLTMRVDLPASKYEEPSAVRAFFERTLTEMHAEPGVVDVALSSHRPVIGGEPNRSFRIFGHSSEASEDLPLAATIVVSPPFFSVLEVPLLQGRMLSEQDSELAEPVALVSRAAAERYWPGASPVGARIRFGDSSANGIRVVGVVGDLRNPDADQPPEPQVYLPHAQRPLPQMAVLARTAGDPSAVAESLRRAVWQADPDQPVHDVRTMDKIVYDDHASDIAAIGLMTYFSLVALGLATAGIYGVISYSVSQRRHEIGIRMAMGARATEMGLMVVRQGLTAVLVGLSVGLVATLALTRGLSALFYGLTATDPATYSGVALLLVAIAVLASLVPALRAARTNPLSTLRNE